MKQVIIIVGAMVVGAASYALITEQMKSRNQSSDEELAQQARLEAQRKVDEARQTQVVPKTAPTTETLPPPSVQVDEFGTRTNGPFSIVNAEREPTGGSLELIDSAEEKLVHVKKFTNSSGTSVRAFLTESLTPEGGYALGNLAAGTDEHVFGLPLNQNFADYHYVLFWSEQTGTLVGYATLH